jgi:hypothetical protein
MTSECTPTGRHPTERELTWALAVELLRTGQMMESDYLAHCRENGWPTDRFPDTPGGQQKTSPVPSPCAGPFAVR